MERPNKWARCSFTEKTFIQACGEPKWTSTNKLVYTFKFKFNKTVRDVQVSLTTCLLSAVPDKMTGGLLKKIKLLFPAGVPSGISKLPLSDYISRQFFDSLVKFDIANALSLSCSSDICTLGNYVVLHVSGKISKCSKCGPKIFAPLTSRGHLFFNHCCIIKQKLAAVKKMKLTAEKLNEAVEKAKPPLPPISIKIKGDVSAADKINKHHTAAMLNLVRHHNTDNVCYETVLVLADDELMSDTPPNKTSKVPVVSRASVKRAYIKLNDKRSANTADPVKKAVEMTLVGCELRVVVEMDSNKRQLVTLNVMKMDEPPPTGRSWKYVKNLIQAAGIAVQRTKTLRELIELAKLSSFAYDGTYIASGKVPVWNKEGVEYAVVEVLKKTKSCGCLNSKNNYSCCKKMQQFSVIPRPYIYNLTDHKYEIFYDIETWQDERGVHTPCVISYSVTGEPVKTLTGNGDTLVDKFISEVFNWAQGFGGRAKMYPDKNYVLFVVGFNSSRYDDVLITKNYQKKIRQLGMENKYNYSNKDGSIIFNTLKYSPNLLIKFTDVLRFTGFPTSLRNAAKSLKVACQKGRYPFGVLNDLYNPGHKIKRDPTDGFYDLSYFDGDVTEREATLEYYTACMANAPDNIDRDIYFCIRYCEDDVISGEQVFAALMETYKTLLWDEMVLAVGKNGGDAEALKKGSAAEHRTNTSSARLNVHMTLLGKEIKNSRFSSEECPSLFAEGTKFLVESLGDIGKPGKSSYTYIDVPEGRPVFDSSRFHSMSSMAFALMTEMAYLIPHQAISFWSGETVTIPAGKTLITAPTNEEYTSTHNGINGGWVGAHMRGLLINKEAADKFELKNNRVGGIDTLLEAFENIPMIQRNVLATDESLSMVDIVSQYPSSNTAPHYVGVPIIIQEQESLVELVEMIKNAKNISELPPAMITCRLRPPKDPHGWLTEIPTRTARGALSWSYNTENAARISTYTAVDLWLGINKLAVCDDAKWEIYDLQQATVYQYSCPIYRAFVEFARGLKQKGQETGNLVLRTMGKILLNASIGKMGQRIQQRTSVLESNISNFLQDHGTHSTLVNTTFNKSLRTNEYVMKTCDTVQNRSPNHHAATMYSYSRMLIRDIIQMAGGYKTPLRLSKTPNPMYGDTDSAIIPSEMFCRIPDKFKRGDVGLYNYETCEIDYNLELEDVHPEGSTFLCLLVLARKFYAVLTYDEVKNKIYAKIKSKGHKLWRKGDPCVDHNTIDCLDCTCIHNAYAANCGACVFITFPSNWNKPPEQASRLTLAEMFRAAVSGTPGKIEQMRFNRTLELPVIDMESFSIRTSYQPISVGFAVIPGVRDEFWYKPL